MFKRSIKVCKWSSPTQNKILILSHHANWEFTANIVDAIFTDSVFFVKKIITHREGKVQKAQWWLYKYTTSKIIQVYYGQLRNVVMTHLQKNITSLRLSVFSGFSSSSNIFLLLIQNTCEISDILNVPLLILSSAPTLETRPLTFRSMSTFRS